MVSVALFELARRWRQPRYPSMNEWLHEVGSVHTMEGCPAVKRNKVLRRAPAWMNLRNVTVSERSQLQASHIVLFH